MNNSQTPLSVEDELELNEFINKSILDGELDTRYSLFRDEILNRSKNNNTEENQ